VSLAGHARSDFNDAYVLTSVEHRMGSQGYENTFTCLPVAVNYRPPLKTPLPVIAGVVPAIVVGPAGETKRVDQHGRIHVRFPWRSPTQTSTTDPGDAGWVRVAQLATGAGPTSQWLPDIGEEVAVAFEHGDPDRPVVVGSLFNGSSTPPTSLPADKNVALWRVKSTGNVTSELRYDGTPGKEQLVVSSGSDRITLTPGQSATWSGPNGIMIDGGGGQSVTLRPGTDGIRIEGGGQWLLINKDGITASSAIKSQGSAPSPRPSTPVGPTIQRPRPTG
jgi:type VI secretion system secreted protein VgrG